MYPPGRRLNGVRDAPPEVHRRLAYDLRRRHGTTKPRRSGVSFDCGRSPRHIRNALSELRSAVETNASAAAAIQSAEALPDWAAEVEDASLPLTDPWDDAEVQSWADALPDAVAIRLAIRTSDVLTGILLLLATLNPALVPLPIVLAADALIRIARALYETVEKRMDGRVKS